MENQVTRAKRYLLGLAAAAVVAGLDRVIREEEDVDVTEENPEFDFEKQDPDKDKPMTVVTLTSEMLKRRVIWDTVPCRLAVEVIAKMGLSPASEEVEETEHQEAHARLSTLAPLAPVISNLAHHAAESAYTATLVANGEEAPSDSEGAIDHMSGIVFMTASAVLCELLDIGLLHEPFYVEGMQFDE